MCSKSQKIGVREAIIKVKIKLRANKITSIVLRWYCTLLSCHDSITFAVFKTGSFGLEFGVKVGYTLTLV